MRKPFDYATLAELTQIYPPTSRHFWRARAHDGRIRGALKSSKGYSGRIWIPRSEAERIIRECALRVVRKESSALSRRSSSLPEGAVAGSSP